ncbi:MAG TPA: extracellular solute-binding protein [Bacillota bacterium]|nr:extracellular solute-binding protein [Bacillota bacterium]
MKKDYIEIWVMPVHSGNNLLPSYNKIAEQLSKQFKRRVQYKVIPWNKALKMLFTAFKAGNPPDVMQIGSTWIKTFAHMGYLDRVPSGFDFPKPVADWVYQNCLDQGNRIAVPWISEASMITARKDILDAQNVDRQALLSLDGFLRSCDRLHTIYSDKDETILPFVFSLRPEPGRLHFLIPFLRAFGWDLKDFNDADSLFELAKLRPAFDYLKQLFTVSHIDKETVTLNPYVLNQQLYLSNKFVFTTGHWWKIVLQAIDKNHDKPFLEAIPMPAGEIGQATWGGGSMLCVPPTSPYKEEAWTIVQHMISDDFMHKRVEIAGDVPAFESDFWEVYADKPQIMMLLDQVKKARCYPQHPLWISYESIISEGFINLLWHYIYDNQPLDPLYDTLIRPMGEKIEEINSLAWESGSNE